MVLTNKNRQTTLASDLKIAASFIDRIGGLLLPSNPRALLFRTRFGIHTFGLTESIDVLVLDSSSRVMAIQDRLPPHRIFFWNPSYETVIELPSGTVEKSRTRKNDTLDLA